MKNFLQEPLMEARKINTNFAQTTAENFYNKMSWEFKMYLMVGGEIDAYSKKTPSGVKMGICSRYKFSVQKFNDGTIGVGIDKNRPDKRIDMYEFKERHEK